MKARAVTALWRRTERRERVVKTERNRRAVGLAQVPSAMVRSERGSAALRPRSHLTKGSWTLTMTPDWMFDVLNVPSGRTRHALNELGRRLVALGVYAKQPIGPAGALGAARRPPSIQHIRARNAVKCFLWNLCSGGKSGLRRASPIGRRADTRQESTCARDARAPRARMSRCGLTSPPAW
jgi:hypothetical protein